MDHPVERPSSVPRLSLDHASLERLSIGAPPTRIMAPWMLYLLVFGVTTAVGIVCIKFFLADDMLAAVFAAATLGFILAACMCFWASLRASAENASTLATGRRKPPPRKNLVTVRSHIYVNEDGEACETGGHPHMCPICLIDFEEGALVVRLECHHLFHLECISTWVRRKAQCPACRFALPTVSVSGRCSPAAAVVVEEEAVV